MYLDAVTLNVGAAREQVLNAISLGFEKGLETILAVVCTKYAESEASIQGLREQIKANVTILMPNMKHGTGAEFAVNARMATTPDVHIVTISTQPNVSAYVFVGSAASSKSFIYADKAPTTASALVKLCNLTEKLLEGQMGAMLGLNTNNANRTTHTTAATEVSHVHMDSMDDGFWDSTTVSNRNFREQGRTNPNVDRDSAYGSDDGENQLNRSFGSETTLTDSDNHWF